MTPPLPLESARSREGPLDRASQRRAPFTRAHVVYAAAVGLAALAVLVVACATRSDLLLAPVRKHPGAFATFAVLALLSRIMAFRVLGTIIFSLDTGVYVAALLTIGAGPATLVVFSAMMIRGMYEHGKRELVDRDHWPLAVIGAKLLFGPAVTAALTLMLGTLFSPDSLFGTALKPSVAGQLPVWGSVAVFLGTTAALILPQFAVVTVSYRLNGLGWRHILRQVVLPGFLGELAFTPLGFALALAYKDQDIRILGALGVSYVTFNYIFKRMWVKSEAEGEQARELKLVEEVGRAAASTLDVEEMGRRIGMALVGALPGTAGVVLSVVPENGGGPLHFVRAGDRADKPAVLGTVLRVLAREPDWAGEAARIATPAALPRPLDEITVGQVLTCPLVAPNGTRRGFLSIALHAGTRPTQSHHRILASISRQAAIAVENWRLYSMATEDGLTGLYVRRYLETRLAEEFERATRSGSAFCLLLVDVDNLKVVNDLHGHGAGDTLLREVAAALRESIRGMDVACRWGGDEFAVLLPDMSQEDGFAVGQRLAEAVKARTFAVGGATVHPSASVGVAGYPTSGPRDPADLFAIADRALYAVKKSGRKGTVVAAEPREG